MRWVVKQCDILDESADVLICSANPYLNLSGGVGGEFLIRYGESMQQEMHDYLSAKGVRHVPRGEVVRMPSCGSPYRAVFHAVGVDAFYETSAEVVTAIVAKSLEMSAIEGAKRVALAAIATGYGRLPLAEFARGIQPILNNDFPPIEQVVLCLRKKEAVEELGQLLSTIHIES